MLDSLAARVQPHRLRRCAETLQHVIAANDGGHQNRRAHRERGPTWWRADGSSPAPTGARPRTAIRVPRRRAHLITLVLDARLPVFAHAIHGQLAMLGAAGAPTLQC